jgi:O-antigen/teichoic acid export membrane protein
MGNHCAGYALQLGMHALLALLMAPADYGLFVLSLAWLLMLSRVSVTGLEFVITRYVAIYRTTGNTTANATLIGWAQANGLIVSTVLAMSTIAVGWSYDQYFRTNHLPLFLFVAISLPVTTSMNFLSAELRGRGVVNLSSLGLNVLRPTIVIATVTGLWLRPVPSTLLFVLTSYLIASVISLVFLWVIAGRLREPAEPVGKHRCVRLVRLWRAAGWPLMISNLSTFGLRQSDVIILGLFATAGEVANYSIAMRIAGLCIFMTPVVDGLVGHRYAALHAQGDTPALQQLVTRATRATLLATTVAGSISIFISMAAMPYFFNDGVTGAVVTSLCVLGWIAVSIVGQIGYLLSMCGLEKLQLRTTLICGLLSVAAGFLLIPLSSGIGAAIAVGVPLVLSSLLHAHVARTTLRINVSPFASVATAELSKLEVPPPSMKRLSRAA